MDNDVDAVAGAGQRFVNRVIHDLIDQVMQGFQVGAANIHAGPPADSLEPFQDLNFFSAV